MQLFVVSTPECLGEGAELHLHAGSGAGSCVQALLLRQMCVHVAGKGQGFSSIPLTLLSNPGLHRVIPAITHLALVANRI